MSPSQPFLFPLLPPSLETYTTVLHYWKFFPFFSMSQFFISWYPMGKTSVESRFNIPGKYAWAAMETPGFVVLLTIMVLMPGAGEGEEGIVGGVGGGLGKEGLPWENWVMAGLFTIHYLYRALLSPLVLNPSMSPIHPVLFLAALGFQLCNATCLGGWLAGYGSVTAAEWRDRRLSVVTGTIIFAVGLLGNMYHDDQLREIRRAAIREMQRGEEKNDAEKDDHDGADRDGKKRRKKARSVAKVYAVPETGLFRWVLYPHYLCEWIEWGGFWLIGGWSCVPARCFLINEVASMLPRAFEGKKWYVQRFGMEKVGSRKAVVPWMI